MEQWVIVNGNGDVEEVGGFIWVFGQGNVRRSGDMVVNVGYST